MSLYQDYEVQVSRSQLSTALKELRWLSGSLQQIPTYIECKDN